MASYGLDFGTTNSSVSFLRDGNPILLLIDDSAPNPAVVRSALYFYPRKIVFSDDVTRDQLQTQEFNVGQVTYEGEVKNLIGARAVESYLNDNKSRTPGVKRRFYTGKKINVILWVTPSGKVVTQDVPEYFEEYDYGTGRLFHALKTALKSPYYKGNTVFGVNYQLEHLIGLLLSQIKRKADEIIGENIDSVTVGRPVYFSNDPAKDKAAEDRLREAVRQAGFKQIKFQAEPIGAAKYYLSKHPEKKLKILVFDFGGGTLDTTIMTNDQGFKVLATDGVYIGGDLLNSDIFYHQLGEYFGTKVTWGDKQMALPTHIVTSLQSWYGIPNLNNPRDIQFLSHDSRYQNSDPAALDRLLHLVQKNLGFEIYEAIEIAKKKLTYEDSALIDFSDGPIDLHTRLLKSEFEGLIAPRVDEVRKTVLRTLAAANLEPEQIDVVVRTGGSSLIPAFEQMLIEIFGQDRIEEFDPFTSVAAGLALP